MDKFDIKLDTVYQNVRSPSEEYTMIVRSVVKGEKEYVYTYDTFYFSPYSRENSTLFVDSTGTENSVMIKEMHRFMIGKSRYRSYIRTLFNCKIIQG